MQAAQTPNTVSATFEITARDVGSLAVRPGNMAELEQERDALLLACKLALSRIRTANVPIGAHYEFLLEAAVKATEARREPA